ncbi:exosortase-dependent surface protein XDP2 [Nodularia sp. UHCC 0506]|uniref:exosortase-dependent surface protein XDP2 n=1 Tax=Nodularia sp. UHCC 0506 TaxID=3110243 RepID=UPI002B20B601|nr:exosortase-dependent surface protein XDP2 [Nodularia sp. UHCC 0506]MEA5514281.1 exosortase-dependent surface protein XDP2 [Nodularia sp. UHCC 0506]
MKLQSITNLTGFMAAGVLALSSTPAQAFSFTTNFTQTGDATENIFLNSVEKNGNIISDFILVESATIIENNGALGPASSDAGDNADGVVAEDPTAVQIAASLGNLNLNNIIDGEDDGQFKLNLFFADAVDNLFFWERGLNSKLKVEAIDAVGNVLAGSSAFTILANMWTDAGYSIDTTEIGSAQAVGSKGLDLTAFGLAKNSSIVGIRVSAESNFNGPDFKVVGASVPTTVPEPASLLGLGLVAGVVGLSRRRQATNNA